MDMSNKKSGFTATNVSDFCVEACMEHSLSGFCCLYSRRMSLTDASPQTRSKQRSTDAQTRGVETHLEILI